jgi:putative NADPH-quinone reductase
MFRRGTYECVSDHHTSKHQAVTGQQNNVTIHQLYAAYPDFRIDVKREQELLSLHDRMILQFPLYWYSTPALLKQWFDVVLKFLMFQSNRATGTQLEVIRYESEREIGPCTGN